MKSKANYSINEKMADIKSRMDGANKKVEQLKIELVEMEAGKFKQVKQFMEADFPANPNFEKMIAFFKDLKEQYGNQEFDFDDVSDISYYIDVDPGKKEQERILKYTKEEIAHYEKIIKVCAKEMEDLQNPIPTAEEIEKVLAYLNQKK